MGACVHVGGGGGGDLGLDPCEGHPQPGCHCAVIAGPIDLALLHCIQMCVCGGGGT